MSADESLVLSEEELDEARAAREGMETVVGEESGLETTQPLGAPSDRKISEGAFDLIVEFEVSSQKVYTRKYRSTIWPGGASGVTIGIGYDVGYATTTQLDKDFGDLLPKTMAAALGHAINITGDAARSLAQSLAGSVDVPWEVAIKVHRERVLPRWIGVVERSLANTKILSDDSLGALVSLTYNRGTSFRKAGDRYAEMRAIKDDMDRSDFASIPKEFRSMKRIWPTVPGLQKRREREARLFERGLASA
jgi:GH24 family phage-related lysozyme (muramidase)